MQNTCTQLLSDGNSGAISFRCGMDSNHQTLQAAASYDLGDELCMMASKQFMLVGLEGNAAQYPLSVWTVPGIGACPLTCGAYLSSSNRIAPHTAPIVAASAAVLTLLLHQSV